jgi:hypothetical protein
LFADDDELEAELNGAGFDDDSGCFTATTNSEDERGGREASAGKKDQGKGRAAAVEEGAGGRKSGIAVTVKAEEADVVMAVTSTKRFFEVSWSVLLIHYSRFQIRYSPFSSPQAQSFDKEEPGLDE